MREFKKKAIEYKKWNNALLKYFFNENNFGKEVILYADSGLINEIGEKNGLGSYEDFLKTIVVDYDKRSAIYDLFALSKSNVEVNKKLKKGLDSLPLVLSTSKARQDISFFNYIIFYVTVYSSQANQKSFYNKLNSIIGNYLPEHKRISPLKGLDNLFDIMEEWSLKNNNGIFRARRISDYSYVGLLNYQVVLTPQQNQIFEKTLYQHGISIDDNAIYPELANKILPYVDNKHLRNKLKDAVKKPVYAEWFLNRALSFDHEEYNKSINDEEIFVSRKGKLTFKISLEDHLLYLVSDTLVEESDVTNSFYLNTSGLERTGYYSAPIEFLNNDPVTFEEYKLATENNTLLLETININEVNFFAKIDKDYILTLLPEYGYDLLILVKNKKQTIKKWEDWSSKTKNIEHSEQIKETKNLTKLFSDEYLFYSAKNIKKPFYKNEDNIIYETGYSEDLKIKKYGGLKVNKNTYLDIGLPYFQLDDTSIKASDVNVKVYRNSAKDNDFNFNWTDNKCRLDISDKVTIDESSHVIVKFSYKNIEKTFDFSIKGSKYKSKPDLKRIKINSWGESASEDEVKYLQGNTVINGQDVFLNSSGHKLEGLLDSSSYDDNYFIYLLTGRDFLNDNDFLERKHINDAIDSTITYLESKEYSIKSEKYSRTNLINNLNALGFLDTIKDSNSKEIYQLLPPGLIKIEKSFDLGSKQVYQLIGTRSKFMIQKLTEFCDEKNIKLKYKRYNIEENNNLEKALLPEIIYLDVGQKLDEVKSFFDNEFNVNLRVEDKQHIGDTICKFISSVSEFDDKYLKNRIPLSNQKFEEPDSSVYPRIRISSDIYKSNGQTYKKRYIEKKENEFYEVTNINWSRLYVAYAKDRPVVLMKRQKNKDDYTLHPQTFIPSKYRLPNIVYKAFCRINHGIPKTIKVFIKNANGDFDVENQSYMLFDFYKFSDKEGRREEIVRILSGAADINTSQVKFFNDHKNDMKFVNCSLYSSITHASIIYNKDGECVALISNYKEIFVNADLIEYKNIETRKCHFNETCFNIVKVKKDEYSINQLFSKLIDSDFSGFKYVKTYSDIKINIEREEKIFIKELI